jgi:RNA polymerase sigma factor (sigma-70 family)
MNSVLPHLRRAALLSARDGPPDAQLLESFLSRRDEAAFEVLLRRHGPMVLGVCRRVLRNGHDAEDAFQATFLVLARKAGSLQSRHLLGGWLYGVAYRTAMKARAMTAKRRTKEREAGQLPRPEAAADGAPEELLAELDRELHRLPEKYRVPVVLCELEGKSRKEAARLLGLPEGTLSWRLARARQLLARRLARFGPAAPAGALALALPRAVPLPLLASTAKAGVMVVTGKALAAGAVSARVMALAEGVVKAMLLSKLKLIPAVVLALVVSAGAIGVTYRAVAAEPAQAAPGASSSARDELEELRLEIEALRKGLHATREQVKELRAEVQTLKGQVRAAPVREPLPAGAVGDILVPKPGAQGRAVPLADLDGDTHPDVVLFFDKKSSDPVADAEEALKKLRAKPDDKQAAEALERALKQIKERGKPQAAPISPQKK